ncbi:MAG: polyprenyl synthetase family protein [Candidatus Aureabacteria bacterium]|nr:polyprenyl synthetase family protein [Candidatus Auribacterota bacterium]
MDLQFYLRDKRKIIKEALDRLLPPSGATAPTVHESMRYSIFAGGKRLRPILCIATLEAMGKDSSPYLPAACALELMHTYSLIHDDLPAMDDDDLRRGKPTNHKVFGEAVAILAGDALLTLSFELIASMDVAPEAVRVELVRLLARAGGTEGLVGGQALDLSSEGKDVIAETLDLIHARKTAALIEASALFGAVLGAASPEEKGSLSRYGHSLGMAFQITDDLLDAVGAQEKTGKRVRHDQAARKATYPGLHGVEESRRIAKEYVETAVAALESFGGAAWVLREIARGLIDRER